MPAHADPYGAIDRQPDPEHYVTFLDNHDLNERFHQPRYVGQTKLALACLMTLQGIPCIYFHSGYYD